MTKPFSGIIEHQGRLQPYTVWYMGQVLLFTRSLPEAEARLAAEKARGAVGRMGRQHD